MTRYSSKIPRKTLAQTVADNRAQLTGLAKLHGKPPPVFSVDVPKPAKPRNPGVKSAHPSEAQILKSIMAYLRTNPNIEWSARFNSGTAEENGRYVQYHSARGLSDILAMATGGRLVAIEVKSHTGRLMPHQLEFLQVIRNGGGIAGVARSIDDVVDILLDENNRELK